MAKRELPKSLMTSYYKGMLKQIRLMEKATQKVYQEKIIPLIMEFQIQVEQETKLATNASYMSGLTKGLQRLLRQYETSIEGELASLSGELDRLFDKQISQGLASSFINRINYLDKKSINEEIEGVLTKKQVQQLKGLDVLEDQGIRSIVDSSISENVDLIQSIPETYLDRVKTSVFEGLESGKSTKDIGSEIADIGGITERHGQFIARDQLGSVYGDLTKKRQENLGLNRFKWLTSHDSRVRPSHEALDGMIFDWDTGATGPGVDSDVEGLVPGEDYNCRCTSTVVADDVFDLFDRLANEE